MTFTEIIAQVSALSVQERKQLVHFLVDSLATETEEQVQTYKTGAEIVEMLLAMEPIEFIDAEVEDPTEWVALQREKERRKRLGDWGETHD